MQQVRVWLVEDEQGIADTLIYMLTQEGFLVEAFERGLPALEKAHFQVPDVAILDVGLPDISGFELCRQLLERHPALPILFLTARSDEVDRLLGLEIGADDYVAKPFSPREVCARVRTLLRRVKKFSAPSPVIRCGQFELNEPAAQISWCDTPLQLTRYEFLLLKTLIMSPGRVWSRQQLMDKVWADAQDTFDRTVDTHIKTLRAKLRAINPALSPINTHREWDTVWGAPDAHWNAIAAWLLSHCCRCRVVCVVDFRSGNKTWRAAGYRRNTDRYRHTSGSTCERGYSFR